MTIATIERLPLDETFAVVATPGAIDRAAGALRGHGFEVEIVPTGDAARELVLSRIPLGAEVHGGASLTIDTIGLSEVLERSGDYRAIRPRLWTMDRATEADAIRKLGAAPDVFVNSAAAVTEDGALVSASASGSQLGPIASGAGHIYFVIGAQKVVPDVATALQRLETYVFPLEDARAQEAYGMHSALNKILILNGERPGRITIVLVQEAIGF